MWSEPQTGREREKGRLIFFTLSAQFPLYFLPEDPCLQNVQSMLSMDRRLWNLPEQKKYEKKRERETLLLPLALQYRKMELLPRKPHHLVFFTFYPGVPGTLSYYYDQNTWTAHRLPALTLREKKNTNAPRSKVHRPLFLSCITPNWCSCETANGSLGLRFNCG